MAIAWGIEVFGKRRLLLRLIDHPMERLRKAAKTPTQPRKMLPNQKGFCQGPESVEGMEVRGMEVQVANLNRTAKTKRRSKGRTDALKDVMGWKDLSNMNGISVTKNGEKTGDTMAGAVLWVSSPAGSGKSASATGGVKTCDWKAKQERKAKVAKEGAKVDLPNDQPASDENKATNWNETTSRGRSRTKTPKGKNEA